MKGKYTKSDEFLEKCQGGGGGVIFNPKIDNADFRNSKRGVLIMKSKHLKRSVGAT